MCMNDYEKKDFGYPIEVDSRAEPREGSREDESESADE